jgi:diguanylate cyclase (GGDEF)-like protein
MLNGNNISSQLVNKIALLIVVVWTLTIVCIGLLHAYGNKKLALNSALVEAQTLIKQEELNRLWIAENGGLYLSAKPTANLSVNNDQTSDFTLINHIYITRQMYQKLENDYGYRARIVRLDSTRPEGIPDSWERKALQILVAGDDSFHETISVQGNDHLRLIHAARVRQECLFCHEANYNVGDLLGGFSLSIPLESYYTALGTYSYTVLVGYLVIWSLGLLLTRFAAYLFTRQLTQSRAQQSQLQMVETNLHYISYFDPGTNLPNRATFDDRLKVAMAHAVRLEERVAVAVVNIENFSENRSVYGQGVENQLIKKVAENIAGQIRPDDTIARLGNDRLILLLPSLVSRENVARIINNINQAFEDSIDLNGTQIFVKISFGVAIFPDDAIDLDTVVSYAESAAFRVCQQKVSNLQMYSEELNAKAHAHLQLETELRQALNRNEFRVYYQPQIDAPSGRIIGAEALIRWNHPERGLIPPDQFIPLAENNGTIVAIGEWVLRDACEQVVRWKETFQIPFRLGVNISARQFQDVELVDLIDRIILETGIDPADLEVEITEGTIMEDVNRAVEILVDLKVRGVKIAIDDFGTGYSSLSQLKKLPFDRLKVDRSFIADLGEDRDSQVIVEMIIELAAKLNMEIIAEGIETQEQKKFLISRGCYPMQGYYFGKPMPADQFSKFLAESVSGSVV